MEEQLFDVVTCYYPIDFTPPPDEPNFGVTAKQLTTGRCYKFATLQKNLKVQFLGQTSN